MKKWLFVLMLLLGVGVWQHQTVLTACASFFTVNHPTRGADAILVLSGGSVSFFQQTPNLLKQSLLSWEWK